MNTVSDKEVKEFEARMKARLDALHAEDKARTAKRRAEYKAAKAAKK